MPKISVIIPTYNGSAFIGKTLRSVVSQSYRDIEIIVIDDASTDNTAKIVRNIRDRRIRYVRNSKNIGTSKVRNLGILLAKGEYIAYCDHDDLIYSRHIEMMADVLDRHPGIGIVMAKYRISGVYSGRHYRCVKPDVEFSREGLEGGNIVGPPLNVMHRKECTDKVGCFDESYAVRSNSSEDWDLWLRIIDRYEPFVIDEVLSEYIMHGSNRSRAVDFLKSYIYVIRKRIKKYISKDRLSEYASWMLFQLTLKLSFDRGGLACWPKLRDQLLDFKGKDHEALLLYSRGFECCMKGEFSKAFLLLDRFRKWCEKESFGNREALLITGYFMAVCDNKLGNYWDAAKRLQEIMRIDRGMAFAEELLSVLCFNTGQYAKAFRMARDMPYPEADMNNMRGVYFLRKKQHRKAVTFFKKALRCDASFVLAEKNLKIAEKLVRFGDAYTSFKS